MKKSLKQLLTLALAGVMTLGVGAIAAACGHQHTFSTEWSSDSAKHWHAATCEHKTEKSDEAAHSFDANGKCTVCNYQKPDESNTAMYTVTVLSFDNVPVSDIQLTFGDRETVYTTDTEGKVTAELPKATYAINVKEESLPGGGIYTLGEAVSVTADKTEATVTLAKPDDVQEGYIIYTVKVVDPDGNPVKDVRVQLCSGAQCFMINNNTNSRGEARVYLAPDNYEAQIVTGMPDGYTYDINEENHYTGESATAEKPTVTIHLKVAE